MGKKCLKIITAKRQQSVVIAKRFQTFETNRRYKRNHNMKFKYFVVSMANAFVIILTLGQKKRDMNPRIANLTMKPDTFTDSNFVHQQREYPGPKLISFDTVGKSISLGMDYLVPFLEVPVKRKRNAPPKPLVIVNSAAIVSCGLMAVGGMLVGHLIRNLGLEAPDFGEDIDEEAAESRHYRDIHNEDSTSVEQVNFKKFFENVKLVYKNESGARISTTLPSLFRTIEQTFLENDINLTGCLQKSLCTFVLKAIEHVRMDQATDLDRLIDSAFNWPGFVTWLQQQGLSIGNGVIHSNSYPSIQAYCHLKYPTCKWLAPEERLWDLINNNIHLA